MIRQVVKCRYTKFVKHISEAVSMVKPNDTILMGGFGACGLPFKLMEGLVQHNQSANNLTVVGTSAGNDDCGPALLAKNNMLKKVTVSYFGEVPYLYNMYSKGDLTLELVPQGTLAESIRCQGAGIPIFYTRTGVGTMVETGGIVQKYKKGGKVGEVFSKPRVRREIDGEVYLEERALKGDVAFVKGWKADKKGNVVCRGTALNVNADMAAAAKICVVEVDEIVEVGELDPKDINISSILVDIVYKPEPYEKKIEFPTFLEETKKETKKVTLTKKDMQNAPVKEKIARRTALEFMNGMYANLGIGIPTLASSYIPNGVEVTLQSENGIFNMGGYPKKPENPTALADLTNASKQLISLRPGASLFSSAQSFSFIRGRHLDMTILGGLEVSQEGDIANWVVPGKLMKGMGGAMDLLNLNKVIVTMEHTAKNEKKILKKCSIPLTGKGVVSRVITDIAVFDIVKKSDGSKGMVLVEKAFWVSLDDIKAKTEAEYEVSPNIKDIEYSL